MANSDKPLVILASGSASRQNMLQAAGVEFSPQTARVDETALKESLCPSGEPALS